MIALYWEPKFRPPREPADCSRMRGYWSAMRSMIAAVLSDDPSSTINQATGRRVWLRTHSRTLPMYSSSSFAAVSKTYRVPIVSNFKVCQETDGQLPVGMVVILERLENSHFKQRKLRLALY